MRDEINQRFFVWINQILDKYEKLDESISNKVLSRQLVRSCTSSGSNYRVSSRAKSTRDMINKFKIVEEELDESIGWMELIQYRNRESFNGEIKEAREFLAIIVTSINSLRKKL